MAELEGQNPSGAGLVFAAQNNHNPRCGLPPRVHNTDGSSGVLLDPVRGFFGIA